MSEENLDLWIDQLIDLITRYVMLEVGTSMGTFLSGAHTQNYNPHANIKAKIHTMLKEALGSFEPHDISAELHHHDMQRL